MGKKNYKQAYSKYKPNVDVTAYVDPYPDLKNAWAMIEAKITGKDMSKVARFICWLISRCKLRQINSGLIRFIVYVCPCFVIVSMGWDMSVSAECSYAVLKYSRDYCTKGLTFGSSAECLHSVMASYYSVNR